MGIEHVDVRMSLQVSRKTTDRSHRFDQDTPSYPLTGSLQRGTSREHLAGFLVWCGSMSKNIVASASVLILGLVVPFANFAENVSAIGDPHAYFDALLSSGFHYKSYSLRNNAQLSQFSNCSSCAPSVTYDPAGDDYEDSQDAAKIVIPAFISRTVLAEPMGVGATTLTLAKAGTDYVKGRQIRVDDEVMTVQSRVEAVVTVSRGSFGTQVSAHAPGSVVAISNNSLPNQVWLPMGTEDGHTYLTTWDAWYSPETVRKFSGLLSWKTYQFRNMKKSPALWFEVRTRFELAQPGYVGDIDARYYGAMGANVKSNEPLGPPIGQFSIRPETWTRYWMLLDQRSGWDKVSLWAADEKRDPVKLLDALDIEVANLASGKNSIHSFQLEFNTSQDRHTVLRDPLVVYVRNVVMLRDAPSIGEFLIRPTAGTPAPKPKPPSNVHIKKMS